jgi:hypothetical protein
MKNRLITLLIVVCIAGITVFGIYLYRNRFSGGFDDRLKLALTALQGIHTYELSDITRADVQDRIIEIEGSYRLDYDARAYASESTTTLIQRDIKPPKNRHVFTLEHRSISDDIYVKIFTESALLRKTIPYSVDWKHFKSTAVPDRFVDIAVAGPILDNLALFDKNGAYLSVTGKPVERVVASTTYHTYSFTLSDRSKEVLAGPLKGLIDLIATGTITVFVDDTPSVRMMHISGPSYESTSTILRVNTPLPIQAPPVVE